MTSEVPEGWKEVPVGRIISENNKSKVQVGQANDTGKYKFFTSGEAILKYDEWLVDGENIFMATGGVANVKYFEGKCAYSTDTYSLKSSINTKFLFYLFSEKIAKINYSLFEGTGLKHLQKPEFKDMIITIPKDPKEQEKIATILETIDKTINKTKALIDKNKKMKQGLMLDLFYSNNFPMGKIEDLASLQGGFAFSSNDSADFGTRWLKIANVSFENVVWEDISYLPNKFHSLYPAFQLHEGDLIVAMTRPLIRETLKVARMEKSDIPALLNQRVGRFLPKDNRDRDYIYYILQTKQVVKQIDLAILGTDPPNVSGAQLESIRIPLPERNERVRISKIFSEIDKKIIGDSHNLNKLQKMKSGLMQDLLTGKVRVAA